MKFSRNRPNGGYIGTSQFHSLQGLMTINKLYSEYSKGEVWMYPTYWIGMPFMGPTAQEFAGIFYIVQGASGNTGATADSNFAALQLNVSTGATYIVDWGITTPDNPNGVTTAHRTTSTAQYQYQWENVPRGTETPEGYRQVLIRAYPEPRAAGNTLTGVILNVGFTAAGITLANTATTPNRSNMWAYVKVASTAMGSFFGDALRVASRHLQLVEIASEMPNFTSFQSAFFNLFAIRHVAGMDKATRNATGLNAVFLGCRLLHRIPWMDTRKVTSLDRAFEGCSRITTVPPLDFSKVTNYQSAFASCRSIEHLPPLNTSSATNVIQMFDGCHSLRYAPNLNTANVTNFTGMFQACPLITTIPQYNTGNGVTFTSMFNQCASLREIPRLNFSNARSFNSMFANCKRLSRIPTGLTTSQVRDFNSAFTYTQVPVFPALDYSSATDLRSAWLGTKTQHIKGLSLPSGVCMGMRSRNDDTFRLANHLRRVELTGGPTGTINFQDNILSPTALNEIFTGLRNAPVGTTLDIIVSGNWGTGGCDPTIASAKGWNVTR